MPLFHLSRPPIPARGRFPPYPWLSVGEEVKAYAEEERQKGIRAFPEFRVVGLRSKGKVSPLPVITRGQDIASTGSGMEPSLSLRQPHASITL